MRFRNVFMGVGGVLVVIMMLITDPQNGLIQGLPFGAGTIATLIVLATAVLYVGFLHLARKGLFDYIDLKEFFSKALMSPEGSGMAIIGISIAMLAISIIINAAVR